MIDFYNADGVLYSYKLFHNGFIEVENETPDNEIEIIKEMLGDKCVVIREDDPHKQELLNKWLTLINGYDITLQNKESE